ncbi:hypothetical protein SAMN04487958_1232 [Vreelandella subterranea]|uniref:Uncharacterized protein n=1 Tax=Vreelandella subterranea TaxID=416874 RepID=A0A1H9WR85_9GAMM|nr:drug/metabolite transporter [Halomonas subterranea]SES36334.1 hypothetical protein SAMN04487958_1232 [Halomonas subterranea]
MSIARTLSAMVLLGSTHFINGLLARFYPPLNIGRCACRLCGRTALFHQGANRVDMGRAGGHRLRPWGLAALPGLIPGPFAIVVPVSAVAMVTIALGLSLIFLGKRPNAWVWLGVMIALPAIWLTAGGGKPSKTRVSSSTRAGLLLGLGAGLGFALQLHFLGQVPEPSAFYGIALCMLSGAVCCLPFYQYAHPAQKHFPLLATAAGGISALGLTLYALSREGQLAIISIVIVSMYPLM